MQYTLSAATFLALISAVQAQTAGFDAILTPAKAEVVPACAKYVVKWDYASKYAGTVSIQLLQGATSTTLQLGPVLASGVDNSLAAYTWNVDCGLGNDATYGIKITYDNDKTGATFQYSNPFAIGKVAASSSTAAAKTSAPVVNAASAGQATVYSTQYQTITSCAASVTNCPARSTVVSSTSFPVVAATSNTAAARPSSSSASSAVTTSAPLYPAGNGTAANSAGPVGGTVTLATSKTTTSGGAAATTSAPVTAGAARVAMGGVAVVAGLVAAVFAL